NCNDSTNPIGSGFGTFNYAVCGDGYPACREGSNCNTAITKGCINIGGNETCIGYCLPNRPRGQRPGTNIPLPEGPRPEGPQNNPSGQPSSSQPPSSEPTVSEPPTVEPPVSEPPVSEPPVSEPTGSEPPSSEPTGSEPPDSEPIPGQNSPATPVTGARRQCSGPGEGDRQCLEDAPICVADPAAPRGATGKGVCVSATAQCGGTRLISCRQGQICVDDPRDSCDPNAVGTEGCLGICI
ncbi:hypothetical protein LTS18_002765, partial [Coniosporium uncinatum]